MYDDTPEMEKFALEVGAWVRTWRDKVADSTTLTDTGVRFTPGANRELQAEIARLDTNTLRYLLVGALIDAASLKVVVDMARE